MGKVLAMSIALIVLGGGVFFMGMAMESMRDRYYCTKCKMKLNRCSVCG